ncbi:MAG TPA: alpha/beta hydrolase family protein [Pyrinomonadaceae bacterium]|jgi:S-formylglutathione hydrolase FrmB
MKHLKSFAFSILFLALAVSTSAQKAVRSEKTDVKAMPAARVSVSTRELKLASKLMAREMPYRVVLPKNYEASRSERFPVLYLLHGLTGHYDNWTDKTKLTEYAANYNYIIVTPEGNDGWYTDSGSVERDKYESYIVQELIPEIDGKFRTLADRGHRMIAGLSMGGYGSLKFGLKYPEKFVVVGSFSGALGAASWSVQTLGNGWKALTDSIASVYGADDSLTRKDNDIYKIVRELAPEKVAALPFFYVDCGTEDGLIKENRDFIGLLAEKKIPHEFRELPGKHDWVFWDSQVQEFLRLSRKFVK